jgi:hypothetical protein
MKCGTTLLHHYLDLYSDIAMTRRKELNFFSARPTGTLRTATSDRAAGE